MAFESKNLNNISGSMGKTNCWIYDTEENKAAVQAPGYFNDASSYGMQNSDSLLVSCGDGMWQARVSRTGNAIGLEAYIAF